MGKYEEDDKYVPLPGTKEILAGVSLSRAGEPRVPFSAVSRTNTPPLSVPSSKEREVGDQKQTLVLASTRVAVSILQPERERCLGVFFLFIVDTDILFSKVWSIQKAYQLPHYVSTACRYSYRRRNRFPENKVKKR